MFIQEELRAAFISFLLRFLRDHTDQTETVSHLDFKHGERTHVQDLDSS